MKVVPFGGGLGAQIFAAILVNHLRSEGTYGDIYPDVSYFHQQQPKKAKSGEGIHIYPWELGYYGIPLEQFHETLPPKPNWFKRNFLNVPSPQRLEESAALRLSLTMDAFKKDWIDIFPIAEHHKNEALKLLTNKNRRTAVVHLRRTDFLNVASHVVTDSDVLPIMKKMKKLDIERFLFVSDASVPIDFFQEQIPDITDWAIVPSEDLFLAHAVMRLAEFLITSNSQFSLSAALLNKDVMCIIPRVWFGESHAELNTEINKMASWSILG